MQKHDGVAQFTAYKKSKQKQTVTGRDGEGHPGSHASVRRSPCVSTRWGDVDAGHWTQPWEQPNVEERGTCGQEEETETAGPQRRSLRMIWFRTRHDASEDVCVWEEAQDLARATTLRGCDLGPKDKWTHL